MRHVVGSIRRDGEGEPNRAKEQGDEEASEKSLENEATSGFPYPEDGGLAPSWPAGAVQERKPSTTRWGMHLFATPPSEREVRSSWAVTPPRPFSLLDSKLQRLEWRNPRSSGRRPIHFPIPPNVPPIGTRPAFRTRCEYRSGGSMDVSTDLRTSRRVRF